MKSLILGALLVVIASFATAHDYTIGGLAIEHPIVYATPKTARSGGGYLAITNSSDTADRLLEVRADFPRVMIHNIEMEGDVAKMVHVEDLDIPAGKTVSLEPGGLHVMFMGLSEPFVVGEKVEATLVFKIAGEVEITFNVEARPAAGATDHSNH